jgi:hypothetical protein
MRYRFLLIAATLFLALPLLGADNFCMDCAQKAEALGEDDVKITATCCMAWDNHCYPGDSIVDSDVGSGCLVSEPTQESGSTYCRSDQTRDKGCPTTGGTGTKNGQLGAGCMYDANGWCDSSCSRCTWG